MTSKLPFHLQGNFAPVSREIDAFDLPVVGALPPELTGVFLRNGPNPLTGTSPNWFVGHGMIHGVRLEDGRAKWYRNRYVRGGRYHHPDAPLTYLPESGYDRTLSNANTHVVRHAGRVFALEEYSFPVEITAEIDTKGPYDFGGKLVHGFSAHAKICPETGEMFSFGYGQVPPYLTSYRFDADGRLVHAEEIPVTGPTTMHDFAITRTKVIFLDLPLVLDYEPVQWGQLPFSWSDDYPPRIGIMPRDGTARDLRWYAVEPCFIFHVGNAYDDGNDVVLEACRFKEIMRKGKRTPDHANHWRFRFCPNSDRAREEALSDVSSEFPRIAAARTGLPNRFTYFLNMSPADGVIAEGPIGFLKHDGKTGVTERSDFAAGRYPGEPVFAPAGAGEGEDSGYVMTFVYDQTERASFFEVFDASNMSGAALASVRLPQRVPYGFHGTWLADEA